MGRALPLAAARAQGASRRAARKACSGKPAAALPALRSEDRRTSVPRRTSPPPAAAPLVLRSEVRRTTRPPGCCISPPRRSPEMLGIRSRPRERKVEKKKKGTGGRGWMLEETGGREEIKYVHVGPTTCRSPVTSAPSGQP